MWQVAMVRATEGRMWNPHHVNLGQCLFWAIIHRVPWDAPDWPGAASRPRPPIRGLFYQLQVLSPVFPSLLSSGCYPFYLLSQRLGLYSFPQRLWLTYWEGFQPPCQWWIPIVSNWHRHVSPPGQVVPTFHWTQKSILHFEERRKMLPLSPASHPGRTKQLFTTQKEKDNKSWVSV